MIDCLVDTCRLISAALEAASEPLPSADELMPLAAYVLQRAHLCALPALLAMLEELMAEGAQLRCCSCGGGAT